MGCDFGGVLGDARFHMRQGGSCAGGGGAGGGHGAAGGAHDEDAAAERGHGGAGGADDEDAAADNKDVAVPGSSMHTWCVSVPPGARARFLANCSSGVLR